MARFTGYSAEFLAFWAAYPRKTGKGAAWQAFQKVDIRTHTVAEMLHSLEWQCRQPAWLRDGGHFIPHPSTWLNQRRWEDEPFHPLGPEPTLKRAPRTAAEVTLATLDKMERESR